MHIINQILISKHRLCNLNHLNPAQHKQGYIHEKTDISTSNIFIAGYLTDNQGGERTCKCDLRVNCPWHSVIQYQIKTKLSKLFHQNYRLTYSVAVDGNSGSLGQASVVVWVEVSKEVGCDALDLSISKGINGKLCAWGKVFCIRLQIK